MGAWSKDTSAALGRVSYPWKLGRPREAKRAALGRVSYAWKLRRPREAKLQVLNIPVEQLSNGVYILTCKNATGDLPSSSKFVVLR